MEHTKPEWQELIEVLHDTRAYLALPENDFVYSGWDGVEDALQEIDAAIGEITAGKSPPRHNLVLLFAPTGAIQEVSLSSGWGNEYLILAARFDIAIAPDSPEDQETARRWLEAHSKTQGD